jgi:hypothetical protein
METAVSYDCSMDKYVDLFSRMNIFVHSSIGLQDFRLVLDESFWSHVYLDGKSSSDTAIETFTTKELCERTSYSNNLSESQFISKNFLQHVARLGGVNLFLQIDGEETSTARRTFSRELLNVTEANKLSRPYLADDSVPRCICNRKLLKESCAYDRDGKLSRGPRYQGSYVLGI